MYGVRKLEMKLCILLFQTLISSDMSYVLTIELTLLAQLYFFGLDIVFYPIPCMIFTAFFLIPKLHLQVRK